MLFGFLKKKPVLVQKTSVEKLNKILLAKIPENAVPYILDLWQHSPFNFTVSRSRKTCLGNYRLKDNQHYISVNGDSNQYAFLVTLIHEIAHQHVAIQQKLFRRRPAPHGIEWKTTFTKLMAPMLDLGVFPEDIHVVLKKHMKNPAASSTKDPLLMKALGNYSQSEIPQGPTLSEIQSGDLFVFNNKKYKKIENRRTRTLVECAVSKKRYTIASFAPIQLLD
ncbi:transcription elongation protein SprT [Lacihabitans sp. LS3-19]|uniref:SprT-like domain-containing protein n=1 Tax=Lacihabitans sp. LS3-19 TaxID=2487335 RepID=UPI0020CC1757|nr:SprT-like domain-containing protein [Lacihabitans sp. LS3-19]MCP9768848.1 transcription elongation protein SprT [Lacihabitans sp. LS3-19]